MLKYFTVYSGSIFNSLSVYKPHIKALILVLRFHVTRPMTTPASQTASSNNMHLKACKACNNESTTKLSEFTVGCLVIVFIS